MTDQALEAISQASSYMCPSGRITITVQLGCTCKAAQYSEVI